MDKMKKIELLKICRDRNIKNYSKKTKEELIKMINGEDDFSPSVEMPNNVEQNSVEDLDNIIKNMDGLLFLNEVKDNSVDLILTDPPYMTSKDSGMNDFYNKVENDEIICKTEEEWCKFLELNPDTNIEMKENYIKYGTIYGKKYCVKTQYGDWDNNFTIEQLKLFIELYYKKLRKGGTIIIWFDLWKITDLKNIMEKVGFKQIRFIEWIKTNAQPLNSNINYLTNCREIALVGIKHSLPTFNSKYDKGIYEYPMANSIYKFHPTQKNIKLFEELINKHSNINDLVMDTFLGSGTTAFACKNLNRKFIGCEISNEYYIKIKELYQKLYKKKD